MKKIYMSFILILLSIVLIGCDLDSLLLDLTEDTTEVASTYEEDTTNEDPDDENNNNDDDENNNNNDDDENTTDPEGHNLFIHYIDVGQGDSIFIQLPNGETMLIDAGINREGNTVADYVTRLGIHTIDYLIGTHPDADHIGGLHHVIDAFDIVNMYLPDYLTTTQTFERLLDAALEKELAINFVIPGVEGIEIINEQVAEQDLIIRFVAPIREGYSNNNNHSIVMHLTYGNTSYLFTGDAESQAEQDMLDAGIDLKADVLKVGHHGSTSSTTPDFLAAVDPSIAVIQAGVDNSYNHPHLEILNRLESYGVDIYRTDTDGTIVMVSNGETIEVGGLELAPIDESPSPIVDHVIINEYLPAPAPGDKEWVELYNPTSQAIDLTGYFIDDVDGQAQPIAIPDGTIIEAGGFYIIEMSNVFNNSGDSVRLIDPNEHVIDEHLYTSSVRDASHYRLWDGGPWARSTNPSPTKNASNHQ